jgi:enoyl-CoA hydratase/carnithine racemase
MKLYTSDEALAVGLINESVDIENVLERSEGHLKQMLKIHTSVFKETKCSLRKNLLNLVDRDFTKLIEDDVKNLSDPFTQKVIQNFMNNLKK